MIKLPIGRLLKYLMLFLVLSLTACTPFLGASLITSTESESESLVGLSWSQYIKGTALVNSGPVLGSAIYFDAPNNYKGTFAIHPLTSDIYYIDQSHGLMKYSALTGLVEVFLPNKVIATGVLDYSGLNLPENGEVLPVNAGIPSNWVQIEFDQSGLLYLITPTTASTSDLGKVSSRVYQINVNSRTSRLYFGGGTSNLAGADPLDASVFYGPTAFDESNSFYYYSPCSHGVTNSIVKLMKVSQTASQTAGVISHVAGNCTATNPTSGELAVATGIGASSTVSVYDSLVVYNNGQTIYFNRYHFAGVYKILADGRIYSTSLPVTSIDRGLLYHSVQQKIYVVEATTGAIREFTPSVAGAGGESEAGSYFVRSDGTGLCNRDGVDAQSACVYVSLSLRQHPDGRVFFMDGQRVNNSGAVRIRYKGTDQKIYTEVGSLSFQGHLDLRQNARAYSGSLYYKSATEPNQESFPAGLYFSDRQGMVIARVDEQFEVVENIWGSQRPGFTGLHASGTAVNLTLPLGVGYTSNGGFTFDNQGLPWIRYNRNLVSLTASKTILARQSAQTNWDTVAVGATVSNSGLSVDGGIENLNVKNQSLLLMGRFTSDLVSGVAYLREFDFANNINKHLFGAGGGYTPTADSQGFTNLQNQNLSTHCVRSRCSIQFFENDPAMPDDDELYFAEGTALRKITNPTQPGLQQLSTVFTVNPANQPASGAYAQIHNFTVSPNKNKVFYIIDDYDPVGSTRNLYCYPIASSAEAWCDGVTKIAWPAGVDGKQIDRFANQYTWKNNNTLFISLGCYGIYKISF